MINPPDDNYDIPVESDSTTEPFGVEGGSVTANPDDVARAALLGLVEEHGLAISEDPGRCEGLLRDACASCGREINVLMTAVDERIPAEILNEDEQLPIELTIGRLVNRLVDNRGIDRNVAIWAVDSWAMAAGRVTADDRAPTLSTPRKEPRAMHAGLIFLAFLGTQVIGGFIIWNIAVASASFSGVDLQNPEELAKALQPILLEFMAYGMIPIMIGSGLVVYWLTRVTAIDVLRDGSPTGVGWVPGSGMQLVGGFSLGMAVAVVFLLTAATLFADYQPDSRGPLAEMGSRGGVMQILWGVVAICCAPLVEEFLFRGIMMAGLSRSFGVPAAAVIVTILFVALHFPELQHYWPGVIGVGGMAVVAMWLRIKTKSLFPAIAVHLGYNGLVVALATVARMV